MNPNPPSQLRALTSRFLSIKVVRPNLLSIRGASVALSHVSMIAFSFVAAFWIRFEFSANELTAHSHLLKMGLLLVIAIKMTAFVVFSLQVGWWRYAGLEDLVRIFVGNVAASAVSAVVLFVTFGPQFPRSIYVIDFLLCFLITAGSQFCVRLYVEILSSKINATDKGILIYGAGAAGRTLLREIRTNSSLGFRVVGFIDDNPKLRGTKIMDVPVLGAGRDIAYVVERYRDRNPKILEVVIAMPNSTGRQMQETYANCRAAGVTCKTVPSIGDVLNGRYLSAQIRNISVEDLLGREQIELKEQRVVDSIAETSVLITGAGGSIGSELSRQTAAFAPKKLVILDRAEGDLFKIEQELRHKYPALEIIPVICDIRDLPSVEEVVRTHGIKSIYHAAAYKHVPMMETHIIEAVQNNIMGTLCLVKAAQKYRVSNFLMISSDKAVNPSSVMGVTKRIAEIIVSAASQKRENKTVFNSVRFGNVVGSSGSVVPIFQAQIAARGPVTVTHRDMCRYFMSIREAVQLVLQASTMGKGSEIFVLDMGEPVRILDLAHNMIHLAGLRPGVDIEVHFTGLRPGEKLFEEISLDGEDMLPTHHHKIRIFKGPATELRILTEWIDRLQHLISRRDAAEIVNHFDFLVPEYKSERLAEQSTLPVPAETKPALVETMIGHKREVTHPRVHRIVREEHPV